MRPCFMPTAELRQRLRAEREALDGAVVRSWSSAASRHLVASQAWRDAASVAAYLAMAGEADPVDALHAAHGDGKSVHVPAISGRDLRFVPWAPGGPLKAGPHGIPEPASETAPACPADRLDLVVVPLVAFDEAGNRVGMGGGYYDRCFAFLRDRPDPMVQSRRPLLVGFAFELQRVRALSPAAWDVPLDAVVTEAGHFEIRRQPPRGANP